MFHYVVLEPLLEKMPLWQQHLGGRPSRTLEGGCGEGGGVCRSNNWNTAGQLYSYFTSAGWGACGEVWGIHVLLKSLAPDLVNFFGLDFKNSFGNGLILPFPVKKVYNQIKNPTQMTAVFLQNANSFRKQREN